MPVYEYRCKACGKTHEIEHGSNDERPTACPACGGQLARVFHPVGVVFKGSGFHKTDYARSGARGGSESGTAEAPPSGASTEKKSDAKPTESKPAADGASSAKKAPESKSPSSGTNS
ncbi:MAG: FmdB family transcriptional regulator [Candidatus Eremiobacteraeota bacterium]|nr:FmdB family transcriptional regulator [Candidatus Eremiobacteraeota bacterium]